MSGGFNVHVPSGFSNPDVQRLSETERSMAGAMGLSDEEFRRSKIEYLAKEERRRQRGRELGEAVEQFLNELGPGYRLLSVTWNIDSLTWRLEIETPVGKENVVLPWELVDDVLDARTRTELQRLRNMVFFGLGRRDMIFGTRK
jgi:hypothetical protein